MSGKIFKAFSVLALAILLVAATLSVSWPSGEVDEVANEDVGKALFGVSGASGYAVVLFFVGVLLLVALLGGVFLAKEEREEGE